MTVTGYQRRALLARHMARTKLSADPHIAEAFALAVCDDALAVFGARAASKASARDLLQMCGILHRDGPARSEPRIVPRGAAPKLDAHRKRARIR